MSASQLEVSSNINRLRGSCADYNANNTWYFNGTNGCFNNNNRYNGNFRCRPVLDYDQYDNERLESYAIPLSQWLWYSIVTAKGKMRKPSYVFFLIHRIDELIQLTHELGNCELMPRESTAHIVFEPRIREIVCAAFSKRVLHTWYIKSLQPYLEKYLYHEDSYSCRVGKGGLKAIQRLQDYIYQASEGYTKSCYICKIDIQAFFMSLDCFMICDIITKFIDKYASKDVNYHFLRYATRVIYLSATKDHLKDMAEPGERELLDPKKSMYNCEYYRGVPIGDWTSQTAGLIVINSMLDYLTSLGVLFIHYTDDNTFIVSSPWEWSEIVSRLEWYCREQLDITLHPKKRYIQHYSKGVELLGYKLRFNRILPSERIYHNMTWYIERTIRKSRESESYAITNKEKILSSVNSYLGLLRHCSAYKLRKRICESIAQSPIGEIMDIAKDYTKISVKPKYTKKAYYHNEFHIIKNSLNLILS